MTDRMIALDSQLIERLETLAQKQGRSVNEVFGTLLEQYPASEEGTEKKNWALELVEKMKAANINWKIDPNASENSREAYKQYVYEKWLRTQEPDADGES